MLLFMLIWMQCTSAKAGIAFRSGQRSARLQGPNIEESPAWSSNRNSKGCCWYKILAHLFLLLLLLFSFIYVLTERLLARSEETCQKYREFLGNMYQFDLVNSTISYVAVVYAKTFEEYSLGICFFSMLEFVLYIQWLFLTAAAAGNFFFSSSAKKRTQTHKQTHTKHNNFKQAAGVIKTWL
jgi:hypothetical protein